MEEKKSILINSKIHTQLKIACAEHKIKVKELVESAIVEKLEKLREVQTKLS